MIHLITPHDVIMKDSSNVVKHPTGVVMWGTDIFL
jgi:hypothetical protein